MFEQRAGVAQPLRQRDRSVQPVERDEQRLRRQQVGGGEDEQDQVELAS